MGGEGAGHSLAISHLKPVPLSLRVLSTPTAQCVEPAGSRSPSEALTHSCSPPFPSCSWSCLALKHPALALPSCIFLVFDSSLAGDGYFVSRDLGSFEPELLLSVFTW